MRTTRENSLNIDIDKEIEEYTQTCKSVNEILNKEKMNNRKEAIQKLEEFIYSMKFCPMDKGLFTIERLRCIDEDKADVCEACENAVSDMEKILQIEEELRKINSDNILNLKDLIFFVFKVDAILKEDKR